MGEQQRDVASYVDSARKKLSARRFRQARHRESDPERERQAVERESQEDERALHGAVEDLLKAVEMLDRRTRG